MSAQLSLPVIDANLEAFFRAAPWRMFARCTRCGVHAYCAGVRRGSLRCRGCFTAPTPRRVVA